MSNTLSFQLFDLVANLSKSERRHFKLYAKRNLGDKDLKFLTLFDLLCKMPEYSEEKVAKKFTGLKPNLISNIKSHLYDQIMSSLRLLYRKEADIHAGELFSFAQLLYKKGLYMQSLAQLEKARHQARMRENSVLLFEIIDFEKKIESRHITRSHSERATELIREGRELRATINQDADWLDLALILYDIYLKSGHTKNREEYDQLSAFFEENLPEQSDKLSFLGRIYRHQCFVWYHYLVQNFPVCYRHALAWAGEFEREASFKELKPDLYMRALHNCLSALYYCNDAQRFEGIYQRLEQFTQERERSFSSNSRVQAFIYLKTHRINLHFLRGEFSKGAEDFKGFDDELESYASRLDYHRILIFWYKIACLHFGSGDFANAVKYLNKIINSRSYNLREDVQCFARILNLVAQYELGNDDVIDYQIRSTYRFLLKMKDLQLVQQAVLNFLRQSVYMDRQDMNPHFRKLQLELEDLLHNRYEWRPLLYLDLNSWLQSKIEDKKVEDIIQAKLQARKLS